MNGAAEKQWDLFDTARQTYLRWAGIPIEYDVRPYFAQTARIDALQVQTLTDEDLQAKASALREAARAHSDLDSLLPDVFAVAREAAARLVGMREASRSRGWMETGGRVIASNVNTFTDKGTTTYRPIVVYSYSVGTIRYMSSRIAFHSLASAKRADAANAAGRYPVGSTVPVLYDPQDPEQAVLERGSNPWVLIITGGVCSILAVWMRMLRARAEKRTT